MKYTNSYSLIHELIKRNLLHGFRNEIGWTKNGCKGIFTVFDIRINQPVYLIEWLKLTLQDYLDKYAIFYLEWYGVFSIDDNDNIAFLIDCVVDLQESNPDVNITRDLIKILVKGLSLEKYDDGEESEEYDYQLNFGLEFNDIDKRIYRFSNFEFKSYQLDPTLQKQINKEIEDQIAFLGLKNIQKNLIDYFVNLYEGNDDLPYSQIFLYIKDRGNMNWVSQFVGTEIQAPENFREYLENISIDFELDLDEIDKNTFGFLNS